MGCWVDSRAEACDALMVHWTEVGDGQPAVVELLHWV